MSPKPATVAAYLASLPPDRRKALQEVRKVILKNLPEGYEEGIQYGMIGYYVPHSLYPNGYHANPKEPLPFATLGSQKNHMALYLMCVYGDSEIARAFRDAYEATGRKLDMGKACLRFKRLDDLPLDVIGATIARVPVKAYCARIDAVRARPAPRSGSKARSAARPKR